MLSSPLVPTLEPRTHIIRSALNRHWLDSAGEEDGGPPTTSGGRGPPESDDNDEGGRRTAIRNHRSQTLRLKGGQSEDVHTHNEEDVLIIRSDRLLNGQVWEDIRAAAGRLWIDNYGKPRVHAPETSRMDKGIARKKSDHGEANFARMLAKVHQSLNGEAGRVLPSRCDLLDAASLTDKQIKEFQFNDRKEMAAQAKALLAGYMDASDVTPDMQAQALEFVKKAAKAQQALTSSVLNTIRKVHPTLGIIDDKRIFVDNNVRPLSPHQLAQLHVKQVARVDPSTVLQCVPGSAFAWPSPPPKGCDLAFALPYSPRFLRCRSPHPSSTYPCC